MTGVGDRRDTPHLFSALIAVSLAAAVLFAGQIVAIHFEGTTVTSTAPALFPLKNQGLAFQRAAARAPNVLPFYGTSELLIPAIPQKGDNFFRTAPTGFQVSPVGGGGANLLIMWTRVGALGSDLRGKGLVISLSAVCLLKSGSGLKGLAANLSAIALSDMIFGTALAF